MSREQKYTAIILKKQAFKEGDEILTIFSREHGKVRLLAKSVKFSKSKLQQRLQALFMVSLTSTLGSLPKVISSEPLKVFAHLREDLSALKAAFYALELIIKFTADNHPNERLFNLLEDFLEFLNSGNSAATLEAGLAKFKIEILESSGLGVHCPGAYGQTQKVFFSNTGGGFLQENSGVGLPVSLSCYQNFLSLKDSGFQNLPKLLQIGELQDLLSQFIEYQLERKVKSEKYLRQEIVL